MNTQGAFLRSRAGFRIQVPSSKYTFNVRKIKENCSEYRKHLEDMTLKERRRFAPGEKIKLLQVSSTNIA
jgi:hypothetical protein